MARNKFRSKGWWMWQFRRPKIWFTGLLQSCVSFLHTMFPKRLSDQELWDKLQSDVEEVQRHITGAFRYRKIFADTTAILQEHPTLSTSNDAGYWYEWLRTIYAHYITMAVRRELDRGAASPNLFRLLHDISK